MTHTGQDFASVKTAEMFLVVIHRRGRAYAVISAAQRNCRHRNRRLRGQCLLDRLQRRVARRVHEPVAIGVNHHIDKVRVIK